MLKGVNQIAENKIESLRDRYIDLFLGALRASVLGNMLAGKNVIWVPDRVVRPGDWVIQGWQNIW